MMKCRELIEKIAIISSGAIGCDRLGALEPAGPFRENYDGVARVGS